MTTMSSPCLPKASTAVRRSPERAPVVFSRMRLRPAIRPLSCPSFARHSAMRARLNAFMSGGIAGLCGLAASSVSLRCGASEAQHMSVAASRRRAVKWARLRGDNDLAASLTGADVAHSLTRVGERIRSLDHRTQLAGFDEVPEVHEVFGAALRHVERHA